MKKVSIITTLLFSLALVSQLFASPEMGKFCPKEGQKMCKGGHHMGHGPFKGSIKYALSHLDLSDGQWKDVKIAFNSFHESMRAIKHGIPLKSLDNGKFNKDVFIKTHPMNQKLAAKAKLLETVFHILDNKQKKKFQMLIGAHQYEMQLRNPKGSYCKNMVDGKMCNSSEKCPTCKAKMCEGKMCEGKICPQKELKKTK